MPVQKGLETYWTQSGFSRVYSNSCCSCSFEPEISQSSHKMYSNNILNFQESMTILNACKKGLETYWMHHVYIYIYIYIYILSSTVVSLLSSVARHAGCSNWDRNPPNFMPDLVYIYIYIYIYISYSSYFIKIFHLLNFFSSKQQQTGAFRNLTFFNAQRFGPVRFSCLRAYQPSWVI